MARKPMGRKLICLDDDIIEILDFIISYKGKDRSHWIRELTRTAGTELKRQILSEQLAMKKLGS